MAKLIFTSRYLKDAKPSQKENYVHYIGTRKGVEKIDTSKKHLPATVSQKKLVHQLLQDFPATKEMLEYEDYQRKPTIENASEFISCALEQNLDIAATRKNYVDYLAHRPRVEKIGEHGLFTDEGEPMVLGQVQNQVADHKGIVWTHVISLRREDAARLGYDSAVQWMALLRSKRAMLCKHMKIDSANLKWYAAFHNESHHPHVHLLVYSVKDGEGYLTKQSIEAMRSELAHDIFRQDFANIYEEQAQSRMDLKERSEVVMKTWIDEIRAGTLKSSEIETSMMQLSKRLQNTGGKKVYGYLKRDVKDLVDHIVDELEKDDRVSALYREWGLWQDEIVRTYRKQTEELPPLSKQPKLKSIKNMVIAETLRLGSHHFLFEENEDGYSEPKDDFFIQEPDPVAELTGELDLPKEQGLVVGCKKKGNSITALVDSGDIHCLMIGAAGVGKTANFLYPNIEYACASGMSFLTTDTKGDLFRNYAGIAKEYYGYRISILDLRNPTRSDGNNILTLVNKYMDEYLKNPENLAAKARAEKYAKITAKTIICSEGASASSYGQNAFFYDAAEGLLTSVILLIAEYCPPEKRHIISVFKLIQDLLAPSPVKNRSLFQLLMDKLPPTHKAKWFAGAALNSADQAMASVLSTTMSRLNAFLDSEMEQILCFESTLDTETFCREKSAIFIVLPEEDNTKYFMVSLFLQQLYREMLTIADEHGGKLPNRVMMFADEIGTIPKIESMEMMFSAGRSRRISMVPIIQSFAQLEKNYGKEGSSIIIDNCQDILFGGFAPNSESAEILSKALGNRTVLSGSISRGKNDPSQSLQMMSRPLMAPEELKTLPKGNFILAKTGVCPMKTRLPLFLKWGIRFEEVYEVPEQAAREVVYADRLELEEEIVRRSDFDEEDLWRGSVESGKLEEASFLGGKAHGETAKEKQHKAATRRLPLRTD